MNNMEFDIAFQWYQQRVDTQRLVMRWRSMHSHTIWVASTGWLWGVYVRGGSGSMWVNALSILMQWNIVWHQHERALSNLSSCCSTVCRSFLSCLVTSGGLGAPFSKATLALDFFLFSGFGVPGCESKSVIGLPALRLLISSYSSNPPSSIACTHGFTWWDIRYAGIGSLWVLCGWERA